MSELFFLFPFAFVYELGNDSGSCADFIILSNPGQVSKADIGMRSMKSDSSKKKRESSRVCVCDNLSSESESE